MASPWPDLADTYAELSAALGDAEFREYNNIKDWGEKYKTLVPRTEDGLRELAAQLKTAHAAGDVKRFELMQTVREQLCLWHTRKKFLERGSICKVDGNGDYLWEFHDSGLADAVLDVASDERIYAHESAEEVVLVASLKRNHNALIAGIIDLPPPRVQLAPCVSLWLFLCLTAQTV